MFTIGQLTNKLTGGKNVLMLVVSVGNGKHRPTELGTIVPDGVDFRHYWEWSVIQ